MPKDKKEKDPKEKISKKKDDKQQPELLDVRKKRERSKDKGSKRETPTDASLLLEPLTPKPKGDFPTLCVLHQAPLLLYCGACEEPVCQQCATLGPHNNQLHRVVDLNSAFRHSVSQMSQVMSSGILAKRDLLLAQIHRLSYRMDEIAYVRSVIEKDARGEFGGVIDRLRGAEGQKLAIIQNEMATLQNEVQRIDSTLENYETYRTNPIEFLLRARILKDRVDSMISNPFKREITVNPYDLPRELTELRTKLQKKTSMNYILKWKDEVIWQLYNSKKDQEREEVERYNFEASKEIEAWSKLTDKYTAQLKEYQMVCYYCAEAMTPETVNRHCQINKKAKNVPKHFQGFTKEAPEDTHHGTGWHYWDYPIDNLFETGHAFNNMQKLFSDQQTEMLQKGLLLQIEKHLATVKRAAREHNINLKAQFSQHDRDNLGMISTAAFIYILQEVLEVGSDKVASFLQLMDPQNQKIINYKDFLDLLNDPKLLQSDKELPGQQRNLDESGNFSQAGIISLTI